ncbi:MAG: LamG domain-containing protein, partial [Flavobacteriales bacterium]
MLSKILSPLLSVLLFSISFISIAQIPDYMPLDSLVAWWPFNGNPNDESGNDHNGTNTGAELTFDRFGNPNQAYFFNGVDDRIIVPHHTDLNSFPITFSWWIKPQANDGDGTVFVKYATATWNGYNITYGPVGNPNQWEVAYRAGFSYGVYQTYDNYLDTWADDSSLFDGQWHHYVFSIDSIAGTFYRDGNVLQVYPWWYGCAGCLGTPGAVTGPWELILGSGVRGLLDDLAIWNTALTAQQVSDLYNASNDVCQATARVFNDLNANCADDDQQLGLPGQIVSVEPGGYAFLTDVMGEVFLCDLPDGDYIISIDTANSSWSTTCSVSQSISIINGAMTPVNFSLTNDNPCPVPDIT